MPKNCGQILLQRVVTNNGVEPTNLIKSHRRMTHFMSHQWDIKFMFIHTDTVGGHFDEKVYQMYCDRNSLIATYFVISFSLSELM